MARPCESGNGVTGATKTQLFPDFPEQDGDGATFQTNMETAQHKESFSGISFYALLLLAWHQVAVVLEKIMSRCARVGCMRLLAYQVLSFFSVR